MNPVAENGEFSMVGAIYNIKVKSSREVWEEEEFINPDYALNTENHRNEEKIQPQF